MIFEWIILVPTRRITGIGFGNAKVDEPDRRWIVQSAKEVLGLDVTMDNTERVNVLQRCELDTLLVRDRVTSSSGCTYCLIDKADGGPDCHPRTLLLLLSDTRAQEFHRHVLEMIQVTVSIHGGNGRVSLKVLLHACFMPEEGSFHRSGHA